MIECQKCHTINIDNAQFCSNCHEELIASGKHAEIFDQAPVGNTHMDERPIQMGMLPRAPGGIINNHYIIDQVAYADHQEVRYFVSEYDIPENKRVRICSNPTCSTIHVPWQDNNEQFCTLCGSRLQLKELTFILSETSSPDIYGSNSEIVPLNLIHECIRPPVSYFVDTFNNEQRTCLVVPMMDPVPKELELGNVLKSGVDLSRGLYYLHSIGIYYGGQIDENTFAWADGRIVWGDFSDVILTKSSNDSVSLDIKAFVNVMSKWLAENKLNTKLPDLSIKINEIFQRALQARDITGEELASNIEQALSEPITQTNVDFRWGKTSDVGNIRSLNEDSILALDLFTINRSQSRLLGVYAVADGMGGHAAGDIASGITINALAQKAIETFLLRRVKDEPVDGLQWIKEAIEYANQSVYELRQSKGTDMGSTLVIALLVDSDAFIGHLGDSRAYLVHGNSINRLTTDHSLVERLVATGQITRDQVKSHPQRNVVYRTIGDKLSIEIDRIHCSLTNGDQILLCSDGLWEMVDDGQLKDVVLNSISPQQACDQLTQIAKDAGGDDNISVIIVEIV